MFEVRFHGRGGQGVVTAAEVLSIAAFLDGRHAQAFPSIGSERTGVPVESYCRIDDRPIRTREPVVAPDALVVQDATLVRQVDLFAGLSPKGYVLVNTGRPLEELDLAAHLAHLDPARVLACPATALALEHLGRPLPNAPLLGGLAALTGEVTLDAVRAAIRQRFAGAVGERNVAAASAAYRLVTAAEERIGASPD